MRRWLVLVMIVLLPLRGWAGDLMSVQMVMAGVASTAPSSVAMPPDCPMQASAMSSHTASPEAADMGSCSSCDLCIPLAEPVRPQLGVAGFASHEKPVAPAAACLSALPAPALKPPIS